MENLGSLAVLLAFCLAVYAIIGSVVGRLKRNPFLILSAERAVYCVWFLITVASGVLVYALVTGDFRYSYVAQYSNRAMSTAYKFSAWWGGQEGSLLQYPMMRIHPPMLYLGYVGMVVPFAFAMGSLITRQKGDAWIFTTRRWSLVTWLFQGVGVLMGASWAYAALGWGGYWAWDPVENASLLPWLSATAYLHSVMMQEKKGMMKVWNAVLVSSSFFLCILGTDLTRSGLVSSVHAFAQSPIGKYFTSFLAIGVAATVYLILKRLDYLESEAQLESVVSRESSFLFYNLVILASCFAVLWGTLFPVISEAVSGEKISLDAVWFNRLMIPIGLCLLFLP